MSWTFKSLEELPLEQSSFHKGTFVHVHFIISTHESMYPYKEILIFIDKSPRYVHIASINSPSYFLTDRL